MTQKYAPVEFPASAYIVLRADNRRPVTLFIRGYDDNLLVVLESPGEAALVAKMARAFHPEQEVVPVSHAEIVAKIRADALGGALFVGVGDQGRLLSVDLSTLENGVTTEHPARPPPAPDWRPLWPAASPDSR